MTASNWREVYAVSSGTYSDYGIIGIYSRREEAEEQAAKLRGSEDEFGCRSDTDARVETFPMDFDLAGAGPRILVAEVRMFADGSVDRGGARCRRGSRKPHSELGTRVRRAWWNREKKGFIDVSIGQIGGQEAELSTRVVKTANEKRTELIALGRWPKEGDKDASEILDAPKSADPKDARIEELEQRLERANWEIERLKRRART